MSSDNEKVERFLQTALEFAEDGRIGRVVIEAMRKGTVSETPPEAITESEEKKWATIRQIALRILNRYWNEHRLPLEIWKGVDLVCEEIKQMKAEGVKEGQPDKYWEWDAEMIDALKITIKRRFNELQSAKFYASKGDLPKAVSWMQGHQSYYIPNPYFLSPALKEEMELLHHERLYGKVQRER